MWKTLFREVQQWSLGVPKPVLFVRLLFSLGPVKLIYDIYLRLYSYLSFVFSEKYSSGRQVFLNRFCSYGFCLAWDLSEWFMAHLPSCMRVCACLFRGKHTGVQAGVLIYVHSNRPSFVRSRIVIWNMSSWIITYTRVLYKSVPVGETHQTSKYTTIHDYKTVFSQPETIYHFLIDVCKNQMFIIIV